MQCVTKAHQISKKDIHQISKLLGMHFALFLKTPDYMMKKNCTNIIL